MKTLFYILNFFLPIVVSAQPGWYKSSPLDYMWKNVGSAGFTPNVAEYTSLAFDQSGQPYIAFKDCYGGFNGPVGKATVMKFDGTNWVYVGSPRFSTDTINSISLAFDTSGQPYVAFINITVYWGVGKVTVMKFNGTNWINVGTPKFSNEGTNVTLKFSPSNQPYVGFIDENNGYSPTVMKFDGTNWVNVGLPGLAPGGVNTFSLAMGPSGDPYVGFDDGAANWKASVMKFDGTNWVYVGSKGFSAADAVGPILAFDLSGEPYLAFSDWAYSEKATVMKFNGTGWVNVGNPGFTLYWAGIGGISFSSSGLPYVAFNDGYYSNVSVMSFNNTTWDYVGSGGFSAGGGGYLSFTFSPSGQPSVAYEDYGNSKKATVMQYDSVYVGINNHENSHLSIYPDPAIDHIVIDLRNDKNEVKDIEVFDARGRLIVKTQSLEATLILNVKDFPAGIYIVKINTKSYIYTRKFCKK